MKHNADGWGQGGRLNNLPHMQALAEGAESPLDGLMKLTSYRLKDHVHIQDLDAAGLIPPAIEAALSLELRQRLVRALR